MGSDTGRDPETFGLDQYWRRRVMVLGGLFGTIGLVVWGCSAGGGGEKQTRQPVQNAAAVAPPPTVPAVPTAVPTVTVTATAKVTQTPKKRDGDACEGGDVVINMAMSSETYTKGQTPSFQYTVVNTGDRSCTFDVGSGSLDVRIVSGRDRIWTRSACDKGSGTAIQLLKRGVPYAGSITWDRMRGTGKCRDKREKARPGTYVATVKADGVKVPKQVFALR